MEYVRQDVSSLMEYKDGYAVEASLLIAETLQEVQLTDGIHAYLQSIATCAQQAYLRTDTVAEQIWRWESQLREHEEHAQEYTTKDSVRRLEGVLTRAVEDIEAQKPIWQQTAQQITREWKWRQQQAATDQCCQQCDATWRFCVCEYAQLRNDEPCARCDAPNKYCVCDMCV